MNGILSKFATETVLCTLVEIVLEKDIKQCQIKLKSFVKCKDFHRAF